ncbi:hypothetical protein HBI23_168540 [Parastagonospora nodorum]|nr:hypothetical protein HBI47_032280 [Parastagonospora nodorum]KAH5651537.1 hypothetical protein HBI23_168540 [Parastagonospora nodorum]
MAFTKKTPSMVYHSRSTTMKKDRLHRTAHDYEKPKDHIRITLRLDGERVPGKLMRSEEFRGRFWEGTTSGVRSNEGDKWVFSNFAFSDLKTVDSGSRRAGDRLMKHLKHMGEITAECHYVTNLKPVPDCLRRVPKGHRLEDIPEKALKGRALSHQSTFGTPAPAKPSFGVSSDYLDPEKKPFAIFHFKYRSRDALKALMIIPRSPSPVPLEDRYVDTLSPQEMRQLLRRQRERQQAAQAVKQEQGVKHECSRERSRAIHDFDSDGDEVSFVSAKRRRHPVIIDGNGAETIDLT